MPVPTRHLGLRLGAAALLLAAGFALGRRPSPADSSAPAAPAPRAEAVTPAVRGAPGRSSPPPGDLPVQALVERLRFVPEQDLVGVVETLGRLPRLDDSQAAAAWQGLERLPPRQDYVGCLAAGYLWHRVASSRPETPFPANRGLEPYRQALEGTLPGSPDTAARLAAGEPVDAVARRAFFLAEIARDPVAALALWRRFSDVEGHYDEVELFGNAFANADTRQRMMAALLPPRGTVDDTTAFLLAGLARTWMQQDFPGVENWLDHEVPATLRPIVAAAMLRHLAETNPARALDWRAAELPAGTRAQAVDLALARLAGEAPERATGFLDSLDDPALKQQHTRTFSLYHSLADYGHWKAWRAGLEREDADAAAIAGFETWLNRDPAEASAWLADLPASPDRARLVALMANRLINSPDKAAVIEWIGSIADPAERGAAISAAIRGADPSDTETPRRLMGLAE